MHNTVASLSYNVKLAQPCCDKSLMCRWSLILMSFIDPSAPILFGGAGGRAGRGRADLAQLLSLHTCR